MRTTTHTISPLIDPSFFFEKSNDPIFIFDNDGIVDANNAVFDLLLVDSLSAPITKNNFLHIENQKGESFSFTDFLQELYARPEVMQTFQFITTNTSFWAEISTTKYIKAENELLFSIWRNVTNQKRSRKVDQNKIKKLEDALAMTNSVTWEYIEESDCLIFSKSSFNLFPKSMAGNRIISLPEYEKLIHPDDLEFFRKTRKRISETSSENFVDTIEYRIIRPDGEFQYIYATTKAAFIGASRKMRLHGTMQDVTEINKIEKELNKSREQLSDAISIANLTTWELDVKSDMMKVGSNFDEIFGTEIGTLIKDNYIKVDDYIGMIYPDDMHTYFIGLDKAINSVEDNYLDFIEYRIQRNDGTMKNIFVSIKVRKDAYGNHLSHYGTIQDITDIRETTAEKDRFSSIMSTTTDLVIMLDKNHKFIYLNQAARKFYGFSPEDDINGFPSKLLMSEHSHNVFEEEIFPHVKEKGIWSGENVIQRYDKELIPVSQVVISHKSPDGEVEYYSNIIRDISEQKETEENLRYKNKELDTFVYKASHDLRGPVASLMGLYNIVKNEIEDEKSLEYFELYDSQINRLNDIILTLIQLTKIKETEINRVPIDFSEIVDSCINSFTNLKNFQFINFDINIEVNNEYNSDKGLITTILQNLIENAIKYSRYGERGDVSIELTKNSNNDLLIKVEDHGIGIQQKAQKDVFNMFYRANDSGIGSGLGLYILKNAVDKLKGRVTLLSEVNVGTTFVVKLPAEEVADA